MDDRIQDPSLQGGWKQYYQKQIQMRIHNQWGYIDDRVMWRLFQQQSDHKIELTSQINLSFFYIAYPIQNNFGSLRQFLEGQFKFFMEINSTKSAEVHITKQDSFKNYKLKALKFNLSKKKELKNSIMYRYQRMKERQIFLDSYWLRMQNVIKIKNPTLLKQLQTDSEVKKPFK